MADPDNEPVVELVREALTRSWVLVVTQTTDGTTRYVTVRIPDSGDLEEWTVTGPYQAAAHTELVARL